MIVTFKMNGKAYYLKCINSSSKVKWKLFPGRKLFTLPTVGKIMEKIIEDDAKTSKLKEICQHGNGRQVLEVPRETFKLKFEIIHS